MYENRLLVVGSGGIGCELLKNLVLCGFKEIDVVDMDTIELSNLNRQLLFKRKHVGQSKAQVACHELKSIFPHININAHHKNIQAQEFDKSFFSKFAVILNALDNRIARSHVNKMCLLANIPLIESGSSGYYGQVSVILKNKTECYDCVPHPKQKTYPACTIRNTPSEPIHCIVWAKYLFQNLFGIEDDENSVSPNDDGKSLKSYSFDELFIKIFHTDIKKLLEMYELWTTKKPPNPLDPVIILNMIKNDKSNEASKLHENCVLFKESFLNLKQKLDELNTIIEWDKDNDLHVDFVSSVSNIRSHIFDIEILSKFEIKSKAGNIIPAIASTNAVVAGLMIGELMKILQNRNSECQSLFISDKPNKKHQIIVTASLDPPNDNCYVCSTKPEITIFLDIHSMTIKKFENILKTELILQTIEVQIDDNKGTIIISYESDLISIPDRTTLYEIGIYDNTRLLVDDVCMEKQIIITIKQKAIGDDNNDFIIEKGTDFETHIVGNSMSKPFNSSNNLNDIHSEGSSKRLNEISDDDTDDELSIVCDKKPKLS